MTNRQRLYELMGVILGPLDQLPDHAKMESGGYMPLNLDVIERNSAQTVIALAHYYECNSDLVPDPDMVFALHHANHPTKPQTVEVRSFQNLMTYHEIPPTEGAGESATAQRLEAFAVMWMRNLINQGHRLQTRQ